MINVGVIGVGYWGPNLVRNFSKIEGSRVVAVADTKRERLDIIKQEYPEIRATTDAHQLLDAPDIDAIAVVTPISSHYALVKEALIKGKHVLVEKPLTETVEQASELISLAQKSRKVLLVDHTFIYNNDVRKIQEIIDSGELGEIYYIDSIRANWDLVLFRHDANVIWDMAPHDLSILNFLIKGKPISLSAMGTCYIPHGERRLENIAYVTIQFEGNVLAHLHLSWLCPVKIRRILIGCSRGAIIYDATSSEAPVKVYSKAKKMETIEEAYHSLSFQERIGDIYIPEIEQVEPLKIECQHFLDCIHNHKKPLTGGIEGLNVVQLLEAAQESLANKGKQIYIH